MKRRVAWFWRFAFEAAAEGMGWYRHASLRCGFLDAISGHLSFCRAGEVRHKDGKALRSQIHFILHGVST